MAPAKTSLATVLKGLKGQRSPDMHRYLPVAVDFVFLLDRTLIFISRINEFCLHPDEHVAHAAVFGTRTIVVVVVAAERHAWLRTSVLREAGWNVIRVKSVLLIVSIAITELVDGIFGDLWGDLDVCSADETGVLIVWVAGKDIVAKWMEREGAAIVNVCDNAAVFVHRGRCIAAIQCLYKVGYAKILVDGVCSTSGTGLRVRG